MYMNRMDKLHCVCKNKQKNQLEHKWTRKKIEDSIWKIAYEIEIDVWATPKAHIQ